MDEHEYRELLRRSSLGGGAARRMRERTPRAEPPSTDGNLAPTPYGRADYDRYARLYLAARAGDTVAQRTMIEELNELLWRAARRSGLDRESAADVVQTAWLTLWRLENELYQSRAIVKWLRSHPRPLPRQAPQDAPRRPRMEPRRRDRLRHGDIRSAE